MFKSELYKRGFVPLHPDLSSSGYQLVIHTQALGFLRDAIQDNYASFKLIKKIVAMRSNPRPLEGGIKKGMVDHRQIAIDGILVTYFIHNGTVCIEKITFDPMAKKRHEQAGLHLVKGNESGWEISAFYLKNVTTTHVAVNGQNNSRGDAVEVMSHHLLDAYKNEDIKEFTLFHNPTQSVFEDTFESTRDKLGLSTPLAKSVSVNLNKLQQNKKPTRWVTHSQGGAIFTQAVNIHNKTVGTPLDQHTVFFQASANNMLVTKKILNKAKVKLHRDGYNNNPLDGVPQVVGMNAVTDVILKKTATSLARLLISPLAFIPGMIPLAFMNAQYSTHTRPYKDMKSYGKQVAEGLSQSVKNKLNRFV